MDFGGSLRPRATRRPETLRACRIAALAGVLASCGSEARDPAAERLELSFEDVLAPEAYLREGSAVAEPPDGAPGYWAVAPGLPRPERARVERLDTGAQVQVALYGGRQGPGGAIRLSPAAAEALALDGSRAQVRVTALRREPRISPARPAWRRWF